MFEGGCAAYPFCPRLHTYILSYWDLQPSSFINRLCAVSDPRKKTVVWGYYAKSSRLASGANEMHLPVNPVNCQTIHFSDDKNFDYIDCIPFTGTCTHNRGYSRVWHWIRNLFHKWDSIFKKYFDEWEA